MKKRCLFYMGFFLLAIPAFAQRIDPKEIRKGNYIRTPEQLTKPFEGTWLYTNDTDTFKVVIYLKKKVYFKPVGVYLDYLYGKYLYKKDGIVITNMINSSDTTQQQGFISGTVDRENNTLLYGGFIDPAKEGKYGELTLQLVKKDELKLSLKETEKVSINGQPPINRGFSVPNHVILKRIE